MKLFRLAPALAVFLALPFLLVSCSDDEPRAGGDAASEPPTESSAVGIDPAPVQPEPGTDAVAETPPEPTTPPEHVALKELEQRYPAADQEGRSAIIEAISDREDPGVAPALMRLFQLEKNTDLRGEILSTMSITEGQNPLKLEAVRIGLTSQQTEVKEASLDLLQSVDDATAIPVWQTLLNDPDEDTRTLAKEMIDSLNEPATSPAP